MPDKLEAGELKKLIQSVFCLTKDDRHLLLIVDVPDEQLPDTELWGARRQIAGLWRRMLDAGKEDLGLESVRLLAYPNVHTNNAQLPAWGVFVDEAQDLTSHSLSTINDRINIEEALSKVQIVIALTQLSTTAPLKLLSKKHDFRTATMPGFSKAMIPALRIDYSQVNHRVNRVKEEVTRALSAEICFIVDAENKYEIFFDLRHRKGHASGGQFPENGLAGNLPSGESYIVPYEGELDDVSKSSGILPVQIKEEVVLYKIDKNKAVKVISQGKHSRLEAQRIKEEPAYANISEIGFGVLKDFGLTPIGVTLLDEKLGLHIAFGRSDHFGGAVGVDDFSSPEAAIHIDRIYIPETAPRIHVAHVRLTYPDGSSLEIMKDGDYTIF